MLCESANTSSNVTALQMKTEKTFGLFMFRVIINVWLNIGYIYRLNIGHLFSFKMLEFYAILQYLATLVKTIRAVITIT